MKILIIEDDHNVVQKFLIKFSNTDIQVFPNTFNESYEFNNCNYILELVKSPEKYKEITNYFYDIDLFIIDITLKNSKSEDTLGIDFYNFLKTSNYRNGNYDAIFLTRHSKVSTR